MPEFLVQWTIEVDAATAEDAARLALAFQRAPDSTATVFKVFAEGDDKGEYIEVGEGV